MRRRRSWMLGVLASGAILVPFVGCGAPNGNQASSSPGSASVAVPVTGATTARATGTTGTSGATAAPGTGTTAPARGEAAPPGLVVGPDHNLWVTTSDAIERITPAGEVTRFTGPEIDEPGGIAVGGDGALWFTNVGDDSVGRITTTGERSKFTSPKISDPGEIAAGPDGKLWITNRGDGGNGGTGGDGGNGGNGGNAGTAAASLLSFHPTGGYTLEYDGFADFPMYPISVVSDLNAGNGLWVAGSGPHDAGAIYHVSPSGDVATYTDPGIDFPTSLTWGPDGRLWFTNLAGGPNGLGSVGAMTVDGKVSSYGDPSIERPDGITTGPDGELWVTSLGPVPAATLAASHGDFALVPPEVDAARLGGAGSGPLADAASSWDALARELEPGLIDRMTTDGVVTPLSTQPTYPTEAIVDGPDGAAWFMTLDGGSVGRIDPSGAIRYAEGAPPSSAPGAAAGTDPPTTR